MPLDEKWRSFGWHVQVIDGHDTEAIQAAVDAASAAIASLGHHLARPSWARASLRFMEGQVSWHGTAPNAEQAAAAPRR